MYVASISILPHEPGLPPSPSPNWGKYCKTTSKHLHLQEDLSLSYHPRTSRRKKKKKRKKKTQQPRSFLPQSPTLQLSPRVVASNPASTLPAQEAKRQDRTGQDMSPSTSKRKEKSPGAGKQQAKFQKRRNSTQIHAAPPLPHSLFFTHNPLTQPSYRQEANAGITTRQRPGPEPRPGQTKLGQGKRRA